MRFKIAKEKLEQLKERFNLLVFVCAGLLLSNVVLAFLVYWSVLHESRWIVPTTIQHEFKLSDYAVDDSYLRQMSLFFINERLNVSPETIDSSHQLLLESIAPKYYHVLSDVLADEAATVRTQKISSVFYPLGMTIDSKGLRVEIDGILHRYVGERALPPVHKQYLLTFQYHLGDLKILSFVDLSNSVDSSNASAGASDEAANLAKENNENNAGHKNE